MKKYNLFDIATKLFGMAIVIAVLAVFSSIYVAGVSMAFVGAVVTGEPVSVEEVKAGSPDLDVNYISKKVTEMRPAATPLDTIMRSIGAQVTAKSFVSDYYAVDSRALYDTIHTGYTKAGDGDATYAFTPHAVNTWSIDDTVMIDGYLGVDSLPLVCLVVNKASTTITLQPLNGIAGSGATAGKRIFPASIAADTRFVRMGTAKNELDAQHSPYAIIPVKDYNYMQIFMAQVEEGTFQREHLKEVDWNFSDYEAQNIYDMRATMEFSFMFGYRHKFYDEVDGLEKYTTGGIIRFVTKSLEYGTGGTDRTIDNSTFVDWTKSIFCGNSGSDTRILFGGDGLTANLSKVDTVMKQLEAKSTFVKWGITFNMIETNFGTLLYKHHPLLDLANWGDKGIVLDINNIEKHTFKPMKVRKLDLIASGQRNADAVVIEEATGIITRYPDSHAIISPKA